MVFTKTGNAVKLDTTTSSDEDSGAFSGWSIADAGHFYKDNAWTVHPTDEVLRIAIKGTTAETVVWEATLTSADNWALGSTYTYDGYGSSAFGSITTTQGSLSPDSFTVGTTTHTVQLLVVREGTDNRLFLVTDTALSKSDLAGYAMEFTVDGSTTTLNVEDAADESNLGFYWAESLHSFNSDAWQAKTITVKLLVPGAADDCAEATTTTCSVSLGSSVTGDIESDNDADYFSLTLTSGVTYQIDAEGSDTSKGTLDDPFLYLRNASGTELVSNEDGGTGRNARIVWTATSTETGYVDIQDSSATNTGTYTLTVSAAATNNPATGAPAISGTAQVGQTLTAGTSGIMDADGLTTPGYSYQWIRVNGTDADISGATSGTYTLVAADLGKTIKVEVSFSDDASNAETLTSTATAAVTAAATVPDAIADLLATPGNTQVTLSWTAFNDGGSTITKFEYRQKTSGSYGSWMDISNSPSTVSHTVTGLTTGTAYTFQVRAMNGVGNAGVSNEATATPGYAQTSADVTYVSNIGQGSDDVHSYSDFRAQTFTTGSRTGGYTVTSVDIGSEDAEGNSFTVSIDFTNASGNPEGKLAELTRPASFTAGTLTFTAPPTPSLSPTRPMP